MNYLDGVSKAIQNDLININSGYQARSFRYDLLDKNENFKKTLTNVSNDKNSIAFSNFLQVKRTGTINFIGFDPDIDFINDRIKIYTILSDGVNELTYPSGMYLLSSPVEITKTNSVSEYSVSVYSKTQILVEDKEIERFVIKKGKVYTNVIQELLIGTGIGDIEIVSSPLTVQRDLSFEPGTSKISIINELLKQINYYPIFTNNEGSVSIEPYIPLQERNADYFYRINDNSIVSKGLTTTLDLFNVPNVVTRVVTNAETEPLVSTFKNYDTDDLTSIPNRGREIDDYKEISDIPDQLTLDAFVRREAEEAKKVFGEFTFNTSINPMHEQNECVEINGYIVVESSWRMSLTVSGLMSHTARRVVYV